ncbi:hypothetical protein SPRG_21559, partial [Saprolegnia parasitica CBS 223.65]
SRAPTSQRQPSTKPHQQDQSQPPKRKQDQPTKRRQFIQPSESTATVQRHQQQQNQATNKNQALTTALSSAIERRPDSASRCTAPVVIGFYSPRSGSRMWRPTSSRTGSSVP